jgi:hypothetical protein
MRVVLIIFSVALFTCGLIIVMTHVFDDKLDEPRVRRGFWYGAGLILVSLVVGYIVFNK